MFRKAALLSVACAALVPAARAATADTIYLNAKVVTVDPKHPLAQAVAVSGDKILAVGSTAEMRKLASGSTTLIDLGGKTMLPGFDDNHVHLSGPLQPWKYGGMIDALPAWLHDSGSLPKLLAAISAKAAATPKGGWIVGSIAREEWPNGTLPTRWDLDKVAPDNPVALARGPHTLIVNTKTLELAHVTKDTKPAGGEIVRDANGEPTGNILEAARRVIWKVMPPTSKSGTDITEAMSPADLDIKLTAWRTQLQQLESLGITSMNIAGMRPSEFAMIDEMYRRWGDTLPRMVVQMRLWPGYDQHDDPEEGVRISIAEMEAIKDRDAVFHNPKLKLGAIKMSIDGGLSAPIMWTTKDYENRPGFHGEIRIPESIFYRVAKRAHELNWQIGVHTMGDGAAVMVVEQLEKIKQAEPGPDLRDYLHHVAVMPPEATMQKMGALHINVASQPGFLLALGSYADEALGPFDEAHQDPSKTLLNHGIRVSYGSDAGPYGPISAIYASVTRIGWNGKVHGAGEAVTVAQAIEMHTLEPAYFTFDEAARGSIRPGKLADFVVLDRDPLTIDPRDIKDIKVLRTIVGGREVYSQPITTIRADQSAIRAE